MTHDQPTLFEVDTPPVKVPKRKPAGEGKATWTAYKTQRGAKCDDCLTVLYEAKGEAPASRPARWRRKQGELDSSKAAKKVCAACDIRTMCLDWSIETRQEFGVWGGLSQSERYAITGRRISYGRTRCVKGHKFTDDNVRIRKDGARVCLACERDRGRDAA
jgi:hypothetical protein